MTEATTSPPPPEFPTVRKLQLKKYEADPWALTQTAYPREPKTPSEWFSKEFPEQARSYGTPFLELSEQTAEGFTRINPISANIDFLAATLGGDARLGHQVVYVEGEMQWYFYDGRVQLYKPTSAEKLGNLLRGLLIRCAEELPENVHMLNLFLEFRSDKTIRAVVHRTKSVLAADHTFFSPESKHARLKGVEVHERVARIFVEQILERHPGEVLTLTNAYLYFCEYLRGRGMVPVKRSIFKGMFAPLIRDAFNLGLRNDVIDQATNHQTAGWKGLRALELQETAEKGSNS